jgi:hypothetical protein
VIDVPTESSKSLAKNCRRWIGSKITPIDDGPSHLLGYLTFAKSDPDAQPTPKSTVAIDTRATMLHRLAKMAGARSHLFDDVGFMT